MRSFFRVALMALSLGLVAGVCLTPAPSAAQGCKRQNEGCGAGIGGVCCDGLTCHNGACKRFRQAGEPCGSPADPPCQPDVTSCQAGRCRSTR